MSLLAVLVAFGQSTPSRPPAPPPAPPRRVDPRDYSFVCSLIGRDGARRQISGRFYDNNGALASANVVGDAQIPLPLAGASSLAEHGDFFVKSVRADLEYTWHFSFPFNSAASGGYVTVLSARLTSKVSIQTLGYVATGLCDFKTFQSRMR